MMTPERWEAEKRIAGEILSSVSFDQTKDGCFFIYGTLYCQRMYLNLGPYYLKIEYGPKFPEEYDPNVYLLNYESWHNGDSHIELDGRFCWSEVKDAVINFKKDGSLKQLLENIGFRLAQAEMLESGRQKGFPGPDRKHCQEGEIEASIERRRVKGIGRNTKPCICGEPVKYKNCHGKREIFKRSQL